MFPEKRDMLVEALESEKYEKGKSYLRNNDEFCCLGIACDLYMKETGKGKWVESSINPNIYAFRTETDEENTILPTEVAEWLGTMSNECYWNPEYLENEHTSHSLAELNDNNETFKEVIIALRNWKPVLK